MAALSTELKDWLAARTAEEKEALMGSLVHDAMEQTNFLPVSVRYESGNSFAYVVRDHEESCRILDEYLNQPGVVDAIKKRLESPSKGLTLEEFMDEVEKRCETSSLEHAGEKRS